MAVFAGKSYRGGMRGSKGIPYQELKQWIPTPPSAPNLHALLGLSEQKSLVSKCPFYKGGMRGLRAYPQPELNSGLHPSLNTLFPCPSIAKMSKSLW